MIFDFYVFADDTNLLHSDKDLKGLETVVNEELIKVVDWLDANKLSLNTCLLYTSPSPRDQRGSRMPSSA